VDGVRSAFLSADLPIARVSGEGPEVDLYLDVWWHGSAEALRERAGLECPAVACVLVDPSDLGGEVALEVVLERGEIVQEVDLEWRILPVDAPERKVSGVVR